MKSVFNSILLFCIVGISYAQSPLLSTAKKDSIEQYIKFLEANNQIIGSIAIYEIGKPGFERNFGQSAIEATIEKGDYFKYQVGSISKLFTAVMLIRLQEEKKISFDEPLSNYFKEMPNAYKISLRQMLNHTSGLGDYAVKDDSLFYWLLNQQDQNDIFKEIKKQGVLFQPGVKMQYSNSAYYLLARILEKKYNNNYESILYQQIVKPLGLHNTSASSAIKSTPAGTTSYTKSDTTWEKVDDFYFLNASGVGDIVSTTRDLNIFINALNDGKIISKSGLENMMPGVAETFGLGLMKVPFYQHIGYGHGGNTYGTHCVVSIFPDKKLSIAYCINGEYYPTNDFAKDILSILFERKLVYPAFSTTVKDTSQFDLMVGTYGADDFPISLKINMEGKLLKAQGEGQPSFELTPLSTYKYEYKQAKIVIKFDVGKQSLHFTQAGKSFELYKINVDQIVTKSKLDGLKFPSYTGNYHSDDIPLKI